MHQQNIDINTAALHALTSSHPPNTPIYMLNLLRYRPTAVYSTSNDLPKVSGRDAYHLRYVAAIRSLMMANGSAPVFLGKARAALVGSEEDGDTWDEVALVMYPNVKAFKEMVESEAYEKECKSHREAALEAWRLVAIDKVEV